MSYQTHGHSVDGMTGPHTHGVTSSSMVDLQMNYNTSTEYLADIDEYPLLSSNTSKSQSVPKLTLLAISNDDKSKL